MFDPANPAPLPFVLSPAESLTSAKPLPLSWPSSISGSFHPLQSDELSRSSALASPMCLSLDNLAVGIEFFICRRCKTQSQYLLYYGDHFYLAFRKYLGFLLQRLHSAAPAPASQAVAASPLAPPAEAPRPAMVPAVSDVEKSRLTVLIVHGRFCDGCESVECLKKDPQWQPEDPSCQFMKLLNRSQQHYDNCRKSDCSICRSGRETERRFILSSLLRVPPDTTASPLTFFTIPMLREHIQCLEAGVLTAQDYKFMKKHMKPIVKELSEDSRYRYFSHPVDEERDSCPGYYNQIRHPMDLETIQSNLEKGSYKNLQQIYQDILLIRNNALAFNKEFSPVSAAARSLFDDFNNRYIAHDESPARSYINVHSIFQQLQVKVEGQSVCNLCHGSNFEFSPPVYMCGSCQKKIKRDSFFFVHKDTKINYCRTCFQHLSDPVSYGEVVMQKRDFIEKKNIESSEEEWVECSYCRKWYHIICVLFNSRMNKPDQQFACPFCIILYLEERKIDSLFSTPCPDASHLPRCRLSDYLEDCVQKRILRHRLESAQRQHRDPSQIPDCPGITIRVVSSLNRVFQPKPIIVSEVRDTSYPQDIPMHSKCIVLFQKIDNVDVILMVLYVEEYDHKCPPPNRGRIYISYLDSVKYLRPHFYRTAIFHEIIIGYLKYVKERGFIGVHIWACPPLSGDDYILHIHPPEQKIPRDDRLRKWYELMLDKGKESGVVIDRTTFYDEFLNLETYPHSMMRYRLSYLPYFEGDFWTMEMESRIKKREEAIQKKSENLYDRPSKKSKSRKGGTLSSATARSFIDPSFTELGSAMASQKNNHLFAHLQHWCSLCGNVVASSRWRCRDCLRDTFSLCTGCYSQYEGLPAKERHVHSNLVQEPIPLLTNARDRDPDPLCSCPLFDLRRDFLCFCLNHHFQFDQLRRAKYSSMMILYYVFNKDVDLYPIRCVYCRDYLDVRLFYSCPQCVDFNLCSQCSVHPDHEHPLVPVRYPGTSIYQKLPSISLLDLLAIIAHVSSCRSPSCSHARHPPAMTELMDHVASAPESCRCLTCQSYGQLLSVHSLSCHSNECEVLRCKSHREKSKKKTSQDNAKRYKSLLDQQTHQEQSGDVDCDSLSQSTQ